MKDLPNLLSEIQSLYSLPQTLTQDSIIAENIITQIPPTGLFITSPGTYTFGQNVNWNANPASAAITIVASNVTLDLNNFTLFNTTLSPLSAGILIVGQSNVTVKNGTIQNMNIAGIVGFGVSDINVEKIRVSGLTNTNLQLPPIGILFVTFDRIHITECYINNIHVQGALLAAIGLVLGKNAWLTKIDIENLENQAGVCSGLSFFDTENIISSNIRIRNLKTGSLENINAPGHTCIGIVPFQSKHLKFQKCFIKNIVGSCDDAHGISLFVVDHAIVEDCHVRDVSDGNGGQGAKATGIEVYGTRGLDAQIVVKDCTVENISAINPGNKQAAGYSVAGINIKFICCTAKNVSVYDERGCKNKKVGLGVGFGWAPDIREIYIYSAYNILYSKCKASGCQVGFDTFNHIASKFCPIDAKDNKIPILIEHDNTRIFYCDECSECPDGPTFVPVKNTAFDNCFC